MDECSIDDSYLQLVPNLSPDDLQDLYQYVGISRGEEAQCGVERIGSGGGSLVERIPSGGSVTELQRVESGAKKSNSQQQQSKARRWLLKYVTEYETERQSNWDKRYLQESRIWDTIAYALHYLAGARLSFGGHDQTWQGGLLKEMKRLKQEQDEVLVLDVLQGVLLIVSKLYDLAPTGYCQELFGLCKDMARTIHTRHVQNDEPIKGRACRDLFKAMNNIACLLLLQMGNEQEAEQFIQDATRLVHDDEDDADVFLCNSATLISTTSNNNKQVEGLLLRAEKIAADALSDLTTAVEILKQDVEQTKINVELVSNGSFVEHLPPEGQTFMVRVVKSYEADGHMQLDTKILDNTLPTLLSRLQVLEEELDTQQHSAIKFKLRVLRTYRKLANYYNRKTTDKTKGHKYAKKLRNMVAEILEIEGADGIPIKDAIGNTCVMASYLLEMVGDNETQSTKSKPYIRECFEECKRTIERVEDTLGTAHTVFRTAELYEKGAIAAMLLRQEAELVKEWCLESVRLTNFHMQGSLFHARALLFLAEGFGYCGLPVQALAVGHDAHHIVADLLGPNHKTSKRYNKVLVEHKKIMMKGFKGTSASKIFYFRCDGKQWLRDWLSPAA